MGSKGRKRLWDELSAEEIELTPNPPSPVTLPSLPAIVIPAPVVPLPHFNSTFNVQREEGGDEAVGDGDRFLLFQIAKKYNLEWAISGQASTETGELGRPPTTAQPDQFLFSQGAAVDILSSVNNHLNIKYGFLAWMIKTGKCPSCITFLELGNGNGINLIV